MDEDFAGRWKKEEKILRLSRSLSSSFQVDISDPSSAEEMGQKHSKLGAKPKLCAHDDWPSMSGGEFFTTTVPPWRNQSPWRITTTKAVGGLSDQPKCGVKQQYEALVKKHAVEHTKLMK